MACKDILLCPGSPEFWNDDSAFKKSVVALLANVADGITVTVGTVGLASDSAINDGRKTVAAAGTAEALAASTVCKRVDIQALSTNTGIVVVGGSTVVAAAGTRRGIALEAKQVYSFSIDDLAKIYLDVTVPGEGVSFTYFN